MKQEKSLTTLPLSENELSSVNGGMSNLQYDAIASSRDITGNNFTGAPLSFKFSMGGNKWWIPQKSYFRIRATLSRLDNTNLRLENDIAPQMGFCSNLFSSLEFRLQDKTIARVSDFVAQIDAFETRSTKSKHWMKSLGYSTNFWEPDMQQRQQKVIENGNRPAPYTTDITTSRLDLGFDAAGVNNNSAALNAANGVITFTVGTNGNALPPLNFSYPVGSFFIYTSGAPAASLNVPLEVTGHPSNTTMSVKIPTRATPVVDVASNPTHNFSRILKTNASTPTTRTRSFETIYQPPLPVFKLEHALPTGDYQIILNPNSSYKKHLIESLNADIDPATYKLEINDIQFFCASANMKRVDNLTYFMDLDNTRCQIQSLSTNAFSQKSFDVNKSTYALCVAYQDQRAGNDSRISPSKFKVYNDTMTGTDEELKLTRFYVNFSGKQYPSNDAEPVYEEGKDYTTQRYIDTMNTAGGTEDAYGAESLEDFHKRGPYYYFETPRDKDNASTAVTVANQFNTTPDNAKNMRVLLFEQSKTAAEILIQDGRVQKVDVFER